MIISCDPVCWGSEHVAFNSAVLQMILFAFPGEQLAFFGELSHVKLLQEQMGPALASQIMWSETRIPDRGAKYFERLRPEIDILKQLCLRFVDSSNNLLILQALLPSTLLALKLTRRHIRAGVTVQAMLHGELSQLINRRSIRPLRRLEDIWTAISVWGRRGIQYLVLEENIKAVLLQRMPFLAGRVEVVEHPLCANENACAPLPLEYPIRFGFLGMANEQKGFSEFVQLASKIVRSYGDLVEFHALGKYPGLQQSFPELEALTVKPASTHLTRQDFAAGIQRLHFTVFPYKRSHYALSPSGTLLDALAWEKPLIAARIPLFENMFTRYGNIGHLFGSQTELEQIIEALVRDKAQLSRYNEQVLNLRKARTTRTAAAVAPSYRRACVRARKLRGNMAWRAIENGEDSDTVPVSTEAKSKKTAVLPNNTFG